MNDYVSICCEHNKGINNAPTKCTMSTNVSEKDAFLSLLCTILTIAEKRFNIDTQLYVDGVHVDDF